jgi:hypothetical protein
MLCAPHKEVQNMKADEEKIYRKQREKKKTLMIAARRREKEAARRPEVGRSDADQENKKK